MFTQCLVAKEISWFSNWAPNSALQVPGPFGTVCELTATDKQQSQLGPPPLISSLTRKVGSNSDVRVNDLPGPHNFRRWTVDHETFEDGAWGTPTGVCLTTIKCRQTSTQSSATTEEMLELRRYNTQQTAVSLSTKPHRPGTSRHQAPSYSSGSPCCRSIPIQCDVSSGETQDSWSSRDGARGRWQAHSYIYIICYFSRGNVFNFCQKDISFCRKLMIYENLNGKLDENFGCSCVIN